VQTEANAELASRIQDLEVLTKIRIQKDAQCMEELQDQLRMQQAKSASLFQTTQDQQKDQVLAEKIFKDWLHLRILVPRRMAVPFGRWVMHRHMNARILVLSAKVTRKLHQMLLVPFFVFWAEQAARTLVWRRFVYRRFIRIRPKSLKKALCAWEKGVLTARRAKYWCDGRFVMANLCLEKQMLDKWCEDTYTSRIKTRAVHRAFPRSTCITDAFTVEQALIIQVHVYV